MLTIYYKIANHFKKIINKNRINYNNLFPPYANTRAGNNYNNFRVNNNNETEKEKNIKVENNKLESKIKVENYLKKLKINENINQKKIQVNKNRIAMIVIKNIFYHPKKKKRLWKL